MGPVKNKELRPTLGDYEAMAHLGHYYAEKILGATDLALYDRDGKASLKESGHDAFTGRIGALEEVRGRGYRAV
jgi:hypothetical protein